MFVNCLVTLETCSKQALFQTLQILVFKTVLLFQAVTTTAPLYKQLVNAYAEEAAIEDAIYYLGEALRQGNTVTIRLMGPRIPE